MKFNNNLNNNNPYCASNYPNPLINAGTYDNLIGFNSNPDDKTRYLEGTTFTWDFFVNNRNPIGYHDSSSCDVSTGWTCDEGNFSEHILVDFWEGNDPNNLNYIGQTVANLESEVGVNNACGGTSAHRFRFPTPAAAKTGAETSIYAFGINIGAGNNVLLTESPKTINCAPDPIDGECNTNTTNYYYPQISDIDTNELCNTSGGSTGPTSNGDGTFSWTCLGEHEGDNVSCNTKNLDPDLSVICRFEPYELLSTLELQDNLKVQTYVQGSSLDTNELRYMFVNNDSDLVYEPANGGLSVEGDNYNSWSDKNFLNLKLNQHGVYQIRSYVEYFGEELANDVCEGNFDDHLITLGLPEISFSIDPELANDNNQCQAEISISNELSDQEVECKIVTNEGDVVYDGNDLVNGFNGIIEVTAGTSYKLKCELSDARYSSLNNNGALDDLLETELDRCLVNPDFRQN